MIRLLLMRHGNTFEAHQTPTQVGAKSDLPLTAHGQEQALKMADYLIRHALSPKAIYAGSLKRQTQSADLLATRLSCPDRLVLNQSALDEIDYGLWEGLTAQSIQERWPKEYAAWLSECRWPLPLFGGSLQEHRQAIESWISELRQSSKPGDTLLAVTSNGILRLFYALHPAWPRLIECGQIESLKVKTGHFCELWLFEDRVEIHSWNTAP